MSWGENESFHEGAHQILRVLAVNVESLTGIIQKTSASNLQPNTIRFFSGTDVMKCFRSAHSSSKDILLLTGTMCWTTQN